MRQQGIEALEAGGAGVRLRPGTIVGGRFRIGAELAVEAGTWLYEATEEEPGADGAGGPAPRARGGNGAGNGHGIANNWTVRVIPVDRLAGGVGRLAESIARIQFLRHKNLIDIEMVGREPNFLFVVAERPEGKTLRGFMDAKRTEGVGVSLKGATNLVAHVSNALEHLTQVSAHGALTPAAIWVTPAGRVKVGGFGLASNLPLLARQGFPPGSAETLYVAPEVIAGDAPSGAADVYSLGAICYELLTGRGLMSPRQRVSAMISGVPPAVDEVLERALSPVPERRWPSAGTFKLALQGAAAGATAASESAGADPSSTSNPRSPSTGLVGSGLEASPDGVASTAPRPDPFSVAATATAIPTPEGGARGAGGFPPVVDRVSPSGSAHDDTEERWLVQKGNLDFGPFSLVQMRAQIERGEILADHTVLNNDTGDRCLVKDFPGLGELVAQARLRLDQVRRDNAEELSQNTQKQRSRAMTAIVTLVAGVVALLAVFFVITRRDTSGGHLATREEEAEVETFLKGVKLGGLKATVRRGGGHHGVTGAGAATASGGAADEFNNDARFGDATRGMAQGDQTLEDDQIQSTMMANYRKLIPCIAHAPGVSEIALDFVVKGTGKVSAVRVNGQRGGALPACMLGRMQSFNFPKFDGNKTIASWSMSLGR